MTDTQNKDFHSRVLEEAHRIHVFASVFNGPPIYPYIYHKLKISPEETHKEIMARMEALYAKNKDQAEKQLENVVCEIKKAIKKAIKNARNGKRAAIAARVK